MSPLIGQEADGIRDVVREGPGEFLRCTESVQVEGERAVAELGEPSGLRHPVACIAIGLGGGRSTRPNLVILRLPALRSGVGDATAGGLRLQVGKDVAVQPDAAVPRRAMRSPCGTCENVATTGRSLGGDQGWMMIALKVHYVAGGSIGAGATTLHKPAAACAAMAASAGDRCCWW
jgi:hypothetical protein